MDRPDSRTALRSPDIITGWDNTSGAGNRINFTDPFAAPPLVIATISKRDGGDGGWMRRANVTADAVWLTTDEDQFNDSERSHTTEAASVLAFSDPFAIPEPTTLLVMMAAGLPTLLKRRRSRS